MRSAKKCSSSFYIRSSPFFLLYSSALLLLPPPPPRSFSSPSVEYSFSFLLYSFHPSHPLPFPLPSPPHPSPTPRRFRKAYGNSVFFSEETFPSALEEEYANHGVRPRFRFQISPLLLLFLIFLLVCIFASLSFFS